ncbi:ubiquitin carboxyl-terminal hydrolase 5/13 [Pancytospora epiphaga]|nr:ubiquitin carboxyl-terminal hydrolase 5/13 [Pancytospora epiphaga]
MEYDLTKFRDRCVYCYMGLSEGLVWCSCNLSVCSNHSALHHNKFGCSELFTVKADISGELSIKMAKPSSNEDISATNSILERINKLVTDGITGLDDRCINCQHVPESAPGERSLQDPKCSVCGLNENLWMCLECGNIGCGRSQPGKNGNGHALEHFESRNNIGHAHAVYTSSIGKNLEPDTYCYKCDNFINYPYDIKVNYENPNSHKFMKKGIDTENNKTNTADGTITRSNKHFIGIKNAGETCYISSVLQMLADLYKDCDSLSMHYELCETNPMGCICCQFVRIITTISRFRHGDPSDLPSGLSFLDVSDFLQRIFTEMPQYAKDRQEDSVEFLQNMLLKISFYEDAGLITPVTNDLKFTVETVVECQDCGYSNRSISEDKILYVSHGSSLDVVMRKYFGRASLECECGQTLSVQNMLVNPPGILILSIKRYKMEENNPVKITDPICANNISLRLKTGTEQEYTVKNCIVHTGSSLLCGHYTWWTRTKEGCVSLNDRNVEEANGEAPENGVIFMLRK